MCISSALAFYIQNEAVTCKPEVKPIVAMVKWDKTVRVVIKHLSGS